MTASGCAVATIIKFGRHLVVERQAYGLERMRKTCKLFLAFLLPQARDPQTDVRLPAVDRITVIEGTRKLGDKMRCALLQLFA